MVHIYDYSLYGEPRIIDLYVNNNVRRYKDIILPYGFEWVGDSNKSINGSGISQLDLRYNLSDSEYYYYHWWSSDKVKIHVIGDNHISHGPIRPLPEVIRPQLPESNGSYQDNNTWMSVNLDVDNSNYQEGDMIKANASVYGVPQSNVLFEWKLDGKTLQSNSSSISFKAKKEHDGKQLQVIAKYNGNSTSDTRSLNVSHSKNDESSSFVQSTEFIAIISSVVGVTLLLSILVPIIVIKKKKH